MLDSGQAEMGREFSKLYQIAFNSKTGLIIIRFEINQDAIINSYGRKGFLEKLFRLNEHSTNIMIDICNKR